MQNKHWISSDLFVESFYMPPPVIKNQFSTDLGDLERGRGVLWRRMSG